MQTIRKSLFAFVIAFAILGFSFAAQAQTGHGAQSYLIPAGSEATGYPIVTAVVPVGSYVVTAGATTFIDSDGVYRRQAIITYIVPLSPDPQPTETHLLIAGVCSDLRKAPDGYRKVRTWGNIYGLDNPDTGSFDNTTEFCIVEIIPR